MSKEAALAVAIGSPEPVPANPALIGSAPPAPPVEAPKDLDSAKFAALAKKEAEFVKKQQALKAEQESLAKRKAQVDDILKKRDQFEDTRKTNPVEALKLIGFSEADIFNFLAAQEKKEQTPAEVAAEAAKKAAKEEIDALKKEQADKEAKEQKERDTQLLNEFKSGLTSVVEANKDKYEFCSHYGPQAVDLAYRTVLQIVEDSKGEDIPTAEEAMDMVEELYEEEAKALMALKKTKPKLVETPPEAPENAAPERTRTVTTPAGHTPIAPAIQKTRTLTNGARPTTPSLERKINETREQKRERLIALIRQNGLTK